jgi:hypothetical protein
MRSLVTLALLILVAAFAIAGPSAQTVVAGATSSLDLRGAALLMISVIVIAVETVRRIP